MKAHLLCIIHFNIIIYVNFITNILTVEQSRCYFQELISFIFFILLAFCLFKQVAIWGSLFAYLVNMWIWTWPLNFESFLPCKIPWKRQALYFFFFLWFNLGVDVCLIFWSPSLLPVVGAQKSVPIQELPWFSGQIWINTSRALLYLIVTN